MKNQKHNSKAGPQASAGKTAASKPEHTALNNTAYATTATAKLQFGLPLSRPTIKPAVGKVPIKQKEATIDEASIKWVHYYEFAAQPKCPRDKCIEPPPLATEPTFRSTTCRSSITKQVQVDDLRTEEVDHLSTPDGPTTEMYKETEDESTDEQVFPYCTKLNGANSEFDQIDHPGMDVRGGFAYPTKIWMGRTGDVLNVYFMESDLNTLASWRIEKSTTLGIDTIMDWASEWNSPLTRNIPKFSRVWSTEDADIRVSFKSDERSWSKVESDASEEDNPNKPTMNLNLSRSAASSRRFQRYLVIHEFGHVLGLEHEHQRSDFWHFARQLLDIQKMKNDPRLANVNLVRDFFELKGAEHACCNSEKYDPDSIMHYWFDVGWLQDKYRNYKRSNLSQEKKAILRGIQRNSRGCAEKPSKTDLVYLDELYGTRASMSRSTPSLRISGGPPTQSVTTAVTKCEWCNPEQLDSLELLNSRLDCLFGIRGIRSHDIIHELNEVSKAAVRDYINSFSESSSPNANHLKSHLCRLHYDQELLDETLLQWGIKEADSRFSIQSPREEALLQAWCT